MSADVSKGAHSTPLVLTLRIMFYCYRLLYRVMCKMRLSLYNLIIVAQFKTILLDMLVIYVSEHNVKTPSEAGALVHGYVLTHNDHMCYFSWCNDYGFSNHVNMSLSVSDTALIKIVSLMTILIVRAIIAINQGIISVSVLIWSGEGLKMAPVLKMLGVCVFRSDFLCEEYTETNCCLKCSTSHVNESVCVVSINIPETNHCSSLTFPWQVAHTESWLKLCVTLEHQRVLFFILFFHFHLHQTQTVWC